MDNMILIIGLGNPGKKFERTRHSMGFTVVDEFSRKNNFPEFKLTKKFLAEISEGQIAGEKVILAKPQTFMNESGKAVKKLVSSFKLHASSLFVIHDDIDLPLGKIRISKGRSSAGHKGVESIIKELCTKDFVRFRIGIKNQKLGVNNAEKFVLEKFSKTEGKILKEVIQKTVEAIEMAINEDVEKAMNEYNK